MKEKNIYIIIGMAGSGKSSFAKQLHSWINNDNPNSIFSINLDPATLKTKMPVSEDIKNTINYKEVLSKYNLGPNGGITTSLNLYLLNFKSVIEKIKEDNIIIDTPGQIEAFTWSSPGHVLIETLKTLKGYKMYLIYMIDSFSSQNPGVFMSNMIYAASLMSKFKLETVAVFSKIDLTDCTEIIKWIRNYEEFQRSLSGEMMVHPTYHSMALYFEEFYNSIKAVGVSSITGKGKEEFFECLKQESKMGSVKINETVVEASD